MTNYRLHNKINGRLAQLKRDSVQYISGTIAPAESDFETNDIESLDKALDYFYAKDPEMELFIQPKWMGSRCQLYLHRDTPELNFAVTRNGFKVRLDLSNIFDKMEPIFEAIEERNRLPYGGHKEVRATKVILDGELLPWSAVGSGLIEREFMGLVHSITTEDNFLMENGYSEAIVKTIDEELCQEFFQSRGTMSKKELSKNFPRYETYGNLEHIQSHDINENEKDLAAYTNQLSIYAADGELDYKPFDILRVDYDDETFMVDEHWMGVVSSKYDLLQTIMEGDSGLESGMLSVTGNREEIHKYFSSLADANYEGICIKPNVPSQTDAVHCMKVRNKEYLRIIYGYDYQREEILTELVKRKRTGKKRKISHNEYRLGLQMLKLNLADDNYEEQFDSIAKRILFDIEEEETLDKRL